MRPRLLALDPATKTGWAICEPRREAEMQCGTWKLSGTNHEMAGQLALLVSRCIEVNEIERIAVELPRENVGRRRQRTVKQTPLGLEVVEDKEVATGSAKTTARLWCLQGGISGAAAGKEVRLHTVAVQTWRSSVLGQRRWKGMEAKRYAKTLLRSMGVIVSNLDEAEAGAILLWLNARLSTFRAEEDYINDLSA